MEKPNVQGPLSSLLRSGGILLGEGLMISDGQS